MKSPSVQERGALLGKELKRILGMLTKNYFPQKVILFGSFADGEVDAWSDLDLIVIKQTSKRFWDRISEVTRLVSPEVGVDLLVYTPKEFDKLCRERPFFREEVLRRGRVLYERNV